MVPTASMNSWKDRPTRWMLRAGRRRLRGLATRLLPGCGGPSRKGERAYEGAEPPRSERSSGPGSLDSSRAVLKAAKTASSEAVER